MDATMLIPALLFSVLILQGFTAEERRSDVRAVLGAEAEPGFWPTRGRRGGTSEELPPPFWAHRGRELVPSPCSSPVSSQQARLFAQEPKYMLLQRRESQEQPFWVSRSRKRSQE